MRFRVSKILPWFGVITVSETFALTLAIAPAPALALTLALTLALALALTLALSRYNEFHHLLIMEALGGDQSWQVRTD